MIKEEIFAEDQNSTLNETELGDVKYGSKVTIFF